MPFITVGIENSSEIQLYYEDQGKGDTLVFIHGYPSSGKAWEKQLSYFVEQGYRVITYDRRGFGLSSKTSLGYDFNTFTRDLHFLMTALDLEDVTLVGHSMGTGEVTRYLAEHGPERIRCGVFISPLAPYLLKTADNKTGVDQKVFNGFKAAIEKDRYEFITEFLKNFYNLGVLAHDVSDEKLDADFALAASSSPIAFLKCVDTWTTDFRADLKKIEVPILVIHGDRDNILPFGATAKLLPELINAELKVIMGGSHGILWTHAEDINQMVQEFMSMPRMEKSDEGQVSSQIQ